ncbi:MAG TPA: O-antigen ligase family protein [Verrucomicrobiae bacterium]|nr:O-antigen ligase family protein [Verrucomicrobiae bacterium]
MSNSNHPPARPALQVRPAPWLVFLFLATVLFFVYHDFSNARSPLGNYDGSPDLIVGMVAEGSISRRIALISLGIFAIATLIRHRADDRLRINGSLGWTLVAFAAWVSVSLLWAEDRSLTLTRVSVFAILCVAAVAVVRRFSLREIILWAFFTSGSYLAIGVFAEVLFGTFRPFASGYRFAGTLHPNSQGINCAVLLLSGIAAADVEKHKRALYRVCTLAGFVFLVLTASRTAFAAALLALAVYLGVVSSRRAKMAMAYALSIVFCVLLLGLGSAFLPDLKSAVMLGREDSSVGSFNGRTGIWDEISSYVQRRPVLGYGYGGFWTPSRISEISEAEKWGIPNSHSAYLDYLLSLGAVGLIAYVFLLSAGIRRAFRLHKLSRNSAYAFCGTLLVFCAMNGFLESAAANPSLPMFLTLVILTWLAVTDDTHVQRFRYLPHGAVIQAGRT